MNMSNNIYQFDEDTINELSTIEIAYEILKQTKNPFVFKELAEKIGELKKLNSEKLLDVLPQLYTELNIDGRFIHIGKNEWGLKSWYSLEKAEALQLLKNADDDDEDDEEISYLNDDDEPDEVVVEDNLYKVDKDEDDEDDEDDVEEEDIIIEDELIFEEDDEEDEEKDVEEDDEDIDTEEDEDIEDDEEDYYYF